MPTDSLVRRSAIAAAQDLAAGMRRRVAEATSARTEADARIAESARSASALTTELAALNKAIRTSSDPVLRDRRDLAAGKLADLVGGAGRIDPDGQLRWVLPDGAVLVDGDRAAQITTTPDPTTGFRKVEIVDNQSRRDVTASLAGGRMGADLALRDVHGATVVADLDQLAFDVATAVNGVHAANQGLDGATGRNLFTTSGTATGAAAALDVDPTVAADPRLLAAGAAGAGPGDNRGALALVALRDQAVASGGTRTLGDAAVAISTDLGMRVAEAEAAETRDGVLAEHLTGLRDSLSGVDLNEELATLVQFQHASEAMTRFLTTIDDMLGDMLRRL